MATHPIEPSLFPSFNKSHRFRSSSILVAELVSPPMEDTSSTLKSKKCHGEGTQNALESRECPRHPRADMSRVSRLVVPLNTITLFNQARTRGSRG